MPITIVVEDGTGKVDANAFDSLANLDTYFSDRGNAAWAAVVDAEVKKAAMVRASTYMTAVWQTSWKGRRLTRAQALDWPRLGASTGDTTNLQNFVITTSDGFLIGQNEIPREVKQAFAELSLRALAQDLLPDAAAGLSAVQYKKVEGIEIGYFPGGSKYKRFRLVEAIIDDLIETTSINRPIVRG